VRYEGGGGTYNNLFDAHPPFQIDGNFGCTSGITEMLVQSADGALHLLPAIPDEWPNGTVNGLRSRGGFEVVSLEWKGSRVARAVIRSRIGGNLRLRVPNKIKLSNGGPQLWAATGENSNPFFHVDETPAPIISQKAAITAPQLKQTFLYDFMTQPGRTYTFIQVP
jgi:alpha-L-fucosidase 2